LPSPYLLQASDDNNSYEFISDQGIKYLVYFVNYNSLFSDYPQIADRIFNFNVDVVEGDPETSKDDERVGVTIVEVLKHFFGEVRNAVIYVCDSSDNRHDARRRKFDLWFWKFDDGSIQKRDGLAILGGVEIYNSILVHKDNDRLEDILTAYEELNKESHNK
jgi:hypothetical protein